MARGTWWVVAVVTLALARGAAATPEDRPKGGRTDLDDVTQALSTLGPVVEAMMQAADARRHDAPRLLTEALRTGKADGADIAAIVSWVLKEKEETVAREVRRTLGAIETTGRGPQGERWNETSRALVALFETVLRDAEGLHRRDAASLQRELSAVVDAATPAVAAALREADPVGRDLLIRGLQALESSAPDAGVREGAARALGEIQAEPPEVR